MIKKNKGMAFVKILVALTLSVLLIWAVVASVRDYNKLREGKQGVNLSTSNMSLTYSYCPDAYLLSNISCTKQKVKLYRNNECLVYTIDANSSYYIPANVVFDRIESEPITNTPDYVNPFGTKVVK